MSFKEFQAWLDGYSESFDKGRPNKEQWEKVQKKMEIVYEGTTYIPWYAQYPQFPQLPFITTTGSDTISISDTDTSGGNTI